MIIDETTLLFYPFFQNHSLWLLQASEEKNMILKKSIFEAFEAPETRL